MFCSFGIPCFEVVSGCEGSPNSIDSEWYDGSIKIAYIIKYFENETDCESDYKHYSTYEEAESALLDALLEYVDMLNNSERDV